MRKAHQANPNCEKRLIEHQGKFFFRLVQQIDRVTDKNKILTYNLVNVLDIFTIHFATHLVNESSSSFDQKYDIYWMIPNL